MRDMFRVYEPWTRYKLYERPVGGNEYGRPICTLAALFRADAWAYVSRRRQEMGPSWPILLVERGERAPRSFNAVQP